MFLANCIKPHSDGEACFLRVMPGDMYDLVSILRRMNLMLVRRINLHLSDLLERAVVWYRYPQINFLCSRRNVFDQCFIFKLELTLSWRIRSDANKGS